MALTEQAVIETLRSVSFPGFSKDIVSLGVARNVTVAGGRVYVSRVDAHTVYAVDADSGEIAWSRTVNGPVDSPPTILGNLVLFGCRDGNVYCLDTQTGEQIWRFRAAPQDVMI